MLKPAAIRKLTVQQIHTIATTDFSPPNLLLCSKTLRNRNQTLLNRKQQLLEAIGFNRKDINKTTIELKDSMKEKLRLKEKVVVDKVSRPSAEDMRGLSQTFEVTERQRVLNQGKDSFVEEKNQSMKKYISSHKSDLSIIFDTSTLDCAFQTLTNKCDEQQAIKAQLLAERDRHRNHYSSIQQQIEACRRQYEQIQSNIRKSQRQLIQLTSYYEQRARQDSQMLVELRREADHLQTQLLKGQTMVNVNSSRRIQLEVAYLQSRTVF